MYGNVWKIYRKAQQALVYGQQEAAALNHNYVGTEHLLLGLIRQGMALLQLL